MTTGHIGDLQNPATDEDHPRGIPRPWHLGVASSELFLAILALAVLVLVALAFYFSAQ